MNGRHIVAYGGISTRTGSTPPIIDHILSMTGKARPKICMLPTATGDSPTTIVTFYDRVPASKAERTHVSLFSRTIKDLRSFILSQDVVMVGGGNTANMLAVWRVHGVDEILREAWDSGVILCGGSAGSLCWFECGTTDSFDQNVLHPIHDGLGFLPGSHSPHYNVEPQRRPLYQKLISEGFPAGYAIDNDAAIHFKETEVSEVLSGAEGASAYYVELTNGTIKETQLTSKRIY